MAQHGRVTIDFNEGIHTYVLSPRGALEIKSNNMTIRLSPEGLHRMIDFLRQEGYFAFTPEELHWLNMPIEDVMRCLIVPGVPNSNKPLPKP